MAHANGAYSHDLVVRGGTLIDGTGAEPVTADVAVSRGVITEVGRVSGSRRVGLSPPLAA